MSHAEIDDLAPVLRALVRRIDSALEKPPYNMVLHTSPIEDQPMSHYHWRLEIIPRLMRVAGFEWEPGSTSTPRRPKRPRNSSATPRSKPRQSDGSDRQQDMVRTFELDRII
jgi:diadenosine tetraphosphate (Ap4A) HIT family hydrolase